MSRRYLLLIGAVLAGALAVNVVVRIPRGSRPAADAGAAVPAIDLALRLVDGRLEPGSAAVPKGYRVRLRVTNGGARAASIRLAGYEDRASVASLPPDSTWRAEFLAELPGEDFVWLVDGQPAGRLAVTGSHLVEGHR